MNFAIFSSLVLIGAGAGLVLEFERNARGSNIHNYGQALWWAVSTITTVGYGDRYPVTADGQGVTIVLMIFGIALIGVITASVASFFVGQDTKDLRGQLEGLHTRTEELRDQLSRIETLLLRGKGEMNGTIAISEISLADSASPPSSRAQPDQR